MKYSQSPSGEPPVLREVAPSEFMGGGPPRTTARLLTRVREGLPLRQMEDLRSRLDLTLQELSGQLGLSRATLHRRRREGRLSPEESDRLVRYERLLALAEEVFGPGEPARQWFRRPAVGLGGETPLEYARTELGAREVERLLGRIEHGVYS
ncbi:MAG TPA: DUF2384 domain-containing protein [Verrucomicrobiota bacterium]|nr:DUF2384 domain-containing protein [Verrucomicrobiota bacterium]